MNILISGGCKNGKSFFAQRKAKEMAESSGRPLYYIATMIPHDDEDHARIKRHISERAGWGFTTIEQGKNLADILDMPQIDKSGVFLMDSVTALLGNEMFDDEGNYVETAAEQVMESVLKFARETGSTVFVSDYIYGDADRYDELTECYRKSLACVDRALAAECDEVYEITYGMQERWK